MTLPLEQSLPTKLDSVQMLRAIAAFAVVFHHVGLAVDAYHPLPLGQITSIFTGLGAAGVDLFFVISGYIIYRSTGKLGSGARTAREFLVKRALRVYPAYWVWTSVLLFMWMAGLALRSHDYPPAVIVGSYLLIPVLRPDGSLHPLLDQGWTLAFEMYFYLVFSLTLLLGWRRKNPVWLIATFLLLAVLGLLPIFPVGLRSVMSSPLVAEFILGVGLGWIFSKINVRNARAVAMKAALLVLTLVLWSLSALHGEVEGTGMDRFVIYGLPSVATVAWAIMSKPPQSLCLLTRLGDSSYSIYLTHGFFTLGLGTVLKANFVLGEVPTNSLIFVATAAIFLASSCTYWLVEKPVSKISARISVSLRPNLSNSPA